MFNIIEKRNIFFIISALIIVAGIAGYFVNGGFNADIDFTGGSEIYVELNTEYNETAIRDAVNSVEGVQVSSIQKVEGKDAIIRTNELNPEQKVAVQTAILSAFPDPNASAAEPTETTETPEAAQTPEAT